MDVQRIADTAVAGGDHEGLAVLRETDVADEAFIENFVGCLAVVDAAFVLANHTGALGGSLLLGHRVESPGIVKSERQEGLV